MAMILDFCPKQSAKDKRIVRETAKKLGQVIIFPGVRVERHDNDISSNETDSACDEDTHTDEF